MKHKNTQPLYIFNREIPQNSEPQNGPRSGLDYIALLQFDSAQAYFHVPIHRDLDYSSVLDLYGQSAGKPVQQKFPSSKNISTYDSTGQFRSVLCFM